MAELILKPGREKSVLRHHPWIFSGAIAHLGAEVSPGDTVEIYSKDGTWLARGAYSPFSQIGVRIWTWQPGEIIEESFFENRIRRAVMARNSSILGDTNSFRLIHGESDGFPGLIVDLFDKTAVIQLLSAGPEFWREAIFRGLTATLGDVYLYERSDADVRVIEGLPPRFGPVLRDDVPTELTIREHGLLYKVNICSGHKTGFYLDQRDNRLIVRKYSQGKDILDCFCYTGGFSLNAWLGNARSITAVDESEEALHLFAENLRLNQISPDNITLSNGDVFQLLRKYRDSHRSFDMFILDPPKFAPTTAQVERASRGYKDINLLAMKLLRENGILMTFSCSGGVSLDLFTKIISGAALDSGQDFQILAQVHQAADHPIATNFPEGAYLKGLILRRI